MKIDRLTMTETADAYVLVSADGDVLDEFTTSQYGDWAYRKAADKGKGITGARVVRVTREFRSWFVEVG